MYFVVVAVVITVYGAVSVCLARLPYLLICVDFPTTEYVAVGFSVLYQHFCVFASLFVAATSSCGMLKLC